MFDKQQKTAVVIHVDILTDSNIRKKEHEKLRKKARAERRSRNGVGSKGNSGNWSTGGRDPQTTRVAPVSTTSEVSV